MLLKAINARSLELKGRRPTSLKAHPALPIQGGGLPITIRQLMKTHGVSERTITPNRKHIKKLAQGLIKEKYRRELEPSIIVSLGPQKENEIR